MQKSVLYRIGRGIYSFKNGIKFSPEIPHKLKLLNSKLKKVFPFLTVCLWSSSLLNEFTMHQASQPFLIIETDKDSTNAVFQYLKEKNYAVFIEPTENIIERYASNENKYIVVKPLISETPIQSINNVYTVTLEKVLVDIFCDKIVFSAYQGNEMKTIFREAFNKYSINEGKLFRYANRRGKKEELKKYLRLINGNR